MATTPTSQTTPATGAATPPPATTAPAPTATGSGDAAAAQKEVDDLKKKLAEAEKKLAATGATRQTTAEEDLKAAEAARGQAAKNVNVVGRVGGPFTIEGSGFGASTGQAPWPGQVLVAGRAVPITSWRDHSIKGTLPPDLPAKGEVEVTTASGKLTGKWPPVLPAGRQVTVQTPDGKLVMGAVVPDGPTTGGQPPTTTKGGVTQGTGSTDQAPPPGSTGTMVGQNVGSGATPPVSKP